MKLFGRQIGGSREEWRASIENPTVPVSASNFMAFFGVGRDSVASVTIDEALQVPAFLAGVGFLTRTLSALPLHAYRDTDKGPEKIKGGLQTLVHDAPNREWTSFEWRRYHWQGVFTGGRGLSWIERSGSNIVGIWPMDPTTTQVKRENGRRFYKFGNKDPYPAADVIDTPFMLKPDQLGAYGPVAKGGGALRLALDMEAYARGFFKGGGVPPIALEGPLPAGADAMRRAMADVATAIETARQSDKPIVQIPGGYKLTQIGYDPGKGQLTEARRLQIEESARILQLPPVFVGDLTHGSFTNTEQQDLHLVKHLIGQWAACLEQELNLKLFGQMNGRRYVEHNLGGLMRGDLLARMTAVAAAINTAQLTPDEARAMDNRPAMPGGNRLYIQGATVPLDTQAAPAAAPAEPTPADEGAADV